MSRPLGRAEISDLFEALSAELRRRGARADVFLVGGAAMSIGYDERRTTRDLDAAFAPADVVRDAVAAVASARDGLAQDWLNDAVKGFLPGPDATPRSFFESEWLRVDLGSPEYLLAMKLFSSRPETDAADIAVLYRHLGLTTVEEGLAIVERHARSLRRCSTCSARSWPRSGGPEPAPPPRPDTSCGELGLGLRVSGR